MPPMRAMRRHAVETTTVLLLGTALLLAISASPAGRDKTPAPIIDFTRLKISSGTVALADREDNEVVCCFSLLFSLEEFVEESSTIDLLVRLCCFCDGKIVIDSFLSFTTERPSAEWKEKRITIDNKYAADADHRLARIRKNLMVWLLLWTL